MKIIEIIGLFLFSAALRFWGLNRFNTLVFDEVYYAKYGNYYLTHTFFFDSHPPLGKYLIAIGIWISKLNFFGDEVQNNLTGSLLSPYSYRWLNALIGSLIPLVVAAIAYQLSKRRSFALIAGLFTALDGLLLVESRYALINIYLVFFGLLGEWLFLLALEKPAGRRGFWLILSGICFGASISVKWNGLGFLAAIYLLWILAWLMKRVQQAKNAKNTNSSSPVPELDNRATFRTPLENLARIDFRQSLLNFLLYLGAIPLLVYCLAWIPHLQINPTPGFWELHQQILGYHQQVGSGAEEHPYCSAWYTWPWMIRPVGYFFQQVAADSSKTIYYDVKGMGNPVLWWFSAIAVIVLIWMLNQRISIWVAAPEIIPNPRRVVLAEKSEFWMVLYLVVNYAVNFLPWVLVRRCTFIYLYMGASVFGFLAIAWLVDRFLQSYHRWQQVVALTVIFLISIAFIFWLPVYLGLPLSPDEFVRRMWWRSWI